MPNNDDEVLRGQLLGQRQDMENEGLSGERMEHLGQGGLHTCAFASPDDNHCQ
jgi:hypothetical protein